MTSLVDSSAQLTRRCKELGLSDSCCTALEGDSVPDISPSSALQALEAPWGWDGVRRLDLFSALRPLCE